MGKIASGDTDEHSGRSPRQLVRGNGGVFQRFPRNLQKEALLRVETQGFARSDAKEVGVEAIRTADEATAPRIHSAGHIGIRVKKGVDIPPVAGNLGYGIGAIAKIAPERPRVVAAWKAAGESDDRNRLTHCTFRCAKTRLEIFDGEIGPQQRGSLFPVGGVHTRLLPCSVSSLRSRSSSI